jgi:hypothetical protein
MSSLKREIRMEDLSRTFQDAIRVIKSLGLQYLWIYSLYIVQDSVEDWLAELSDIGKIYKHSFCNLAPTGSSANQGGLFQQRDPCLITPHYVHVNIRGAANKAIAILRAISTALQLRMRN